jgi:mono/diheme cytochrome c family protein
MCGGDGVIGRLLGGAAALASIGGAVFWAVTAPFTVAAGELPVHTPDPKAGERIFDAGGCASCHAAKGAKGEDRLELGGGLELVTDFGTFRAPNISPDPETGIGGWSGADLVNAMLHGVSPEGVHYYPAFPYSSYARMRVEDVLDLKAFLDTLPPVRNSVADHSLGFPYNIRRGLGLWKQLYLDPSPVVALPRDAPADVQLGQYLVEGPGHCGECHTGRNAIGGPDRSHWLAGAPNPEGEGTIPNITSGPGGIGEWSEEDIVYSFESGFLPDFDTYGGSMVAVQENLARLRPEDRAAIAAYLKAAPPLPDAVPSTAPPS